MGDPIVVQTNRSKSLMIYTASGFRTDIETLMAAFDAMKSTKFVVFAKCWRDMSFALIFRGRHNDNEMREFIDEMYLEVLAQLVNNDRGLNQRICCLYLLYGLYFKQPLDQSLHNRHDVKIRITLDQLLTIRAFVAECKINRHLDVVYVWYKLLTRGIQFVFYRYQCIGPSNTRSLHYLQSSQSSVDKKVNELKKSLESRANALDETHNLFVDYKDKVFDGSDLAPEDMPNIINHELWKDSVVNLQKLSNDFKNRNLRDIRTRGRPSIWTPYRAGQETDDSQTTSNANTNALQISVKKKAIQSRDKIDNEASILWTEDIIDSLKRGKRLKNRKKKNKTHKESKTDTNVKKIKSEAKRVTRSTARRQTKRVSVKVKCNPK